MTIQTNKQTNKQTTLLTILAIMLITVFSISCKNNSTMSEFTYSEEPLVVDTSLGIEQFQNMTFISDEGLPNTGNAFYLWVRITDTGIKYVPGTKNSEPNFSSSETKEIPLSMGINGSKKAEAGKLNFTFSGTNPTQSNVQQSGTLSFQNGGKFTLTFTSGTAYDGQTFNCQYVIY